MTDSERLDRLIDAISLLERAEVYSRNRSLGKYKKAVASHFFNKSLDYYRSCLRCARKASFKRRGILPHGANGPILFPEGTRGYTELEQLEKEFLKVQDSSNYEPGST
jgi:hypothetical protein